MSTSKNSLFGVFHRVQGCKSLEGEKRPCHKLFEPVGRSFLRRVRGVPLSTSTVDADSRALPADSKTHMPPTSGEEKTKVASHEGTEDDDYYGILGLGDLTFRASQDQIKKAYRKASLRHHPDKQAGGTTAGEDPHFLKIQNAYEFLCNKDKRRTYDSQLDFDDSIPSGRENLSKAAGGFFGVYGPVFLSNSRFSDIKPVPSLGDDETSDDQVEIFYDFWMNFRSWRLLKGEDEHDVSEAQSREERRWMKQENERQRRKLKKEENERVRKLVERARANDPRVARMQMRKREEKERRRRQRENDLAARRAAEIAEREEMQKLRMEKEARELAEKDRRKKAKRQNKIFRKKTRKRLLNILENRKAEWDVSKADVVSVCKEVDAGSLRKIAGAETDEDAMNMLVAVLKAERLRKEEEHRKRKEELLALEKAQREESLARAAARNIPWSEQELSLMMKGLKKFPGGTRQRWKKIADMVNTANPCNDRKPKDIIKKSHALDAMKSAKSKVDGATAFTRTVEKLKSDPSNRSDKWTAMQQTALQNAMKAFPASVPKKERWMSIASAVPGKTLKDCVRRVREIRCRLAKPKAAVKNSS